MKILVINLEARHDRLAFMSEQLQGLEWERLPAVNGHKLTIQDIKDLGFNPYLEWKDPLLKRKHTLTEIAATISHFRAWERCVEFNEPVLILEDDSELVGKLDLQELNALCNVFNIIYLDHREMFADQAIVNGRYVRPYYPYWNNAYIVTPDLAKRLINSEFKNNLIPVDEFFPLISGVDYNQHCLGQKDQFLKLKKIFKTLTTNPIAFTNSIFKQVPRKVLGSDIENGKQIMSENVHVLTVATDTSKMTYLQKSCDKFGIKLVNLGEGVVWQGGTMAGPGGGQKLNLVLDYLKSVPPADIVLFMDGYDVFVNDDIETIVERFKGFECGTLLAAEKTCWPDKSLEAFFEAPTEYRYLNSGLYIGYARSILALIGDYIENSSDDQLHLQKRYIASKFITPNEYKLDHENYIFQCLSNSRNDVTIKKNNQILNTATNCCTCIVHGNGGPQDKQTFETIFNTLYEARPTTLEYLEPGELKVAAPDILEVDFLSPTTCKKLIQMAEDVGKWESMYGDKFPAQELRIREISVSLFEEMEAQFKKKIHPVIEKYWWPLQMYGFRDAFIIKYSPQTQASLKCHHDASLVSGNIKLNDDYTGGDTYYYRQNYSNINTSVGKIILWPGQVTHGHEGREVTSGTKYNLVIWTSRRPGDINY